MEFSRATEADLEGAFGAFAAAQTELHQRRGADWPNAMTYDPQGRWARVHRHLLEHDAARMYVAQEESRVAGYTAAWVRDDTWFFSALFIDPAFQGRGVGQHLLQLAWDGEHSRRITITEALQPVSNAIYARRGLLPVTPILEFSGRPKLSEGGRLTPIAMDAPALRAIDLAAYGFDREVDHGFWRSTSKRATLWSRDGVPVAYSYQGFYGIGPVAALEPDAAADALREELAQSTGEETAVWIPGTAVRLVEVALASGLRLGDPGLLLLSPPARSPESLAIHSYWLM